MPDIVKTPELGHEQFDVHLQQAIKAKAASRKWKAFLTAFWVSTALFVVSSVTALIVAHTGTPAPQHSLELIFTAGQWVAFNTLTYSIYAGANVVESRNAQ